VEANRGAKHRTLDAIARVFPPDARPDAVVRPFRLVH
jgi:hypothetical protein